MPFLSINGWTVPVINAGARRKLTQSGRRARSFRGQMRDARRFVRRSWAIEACFIDFDDARSLEGLLHGEGHFVDLADGLQASTGLMPLPGYAPALRLHPTTWGAFGLGCASISAATTGTVLAYDAQLAGDWTAIVRRLDAAGAWVGYAQRSDGSAFVGGAASSTFGLPLAAGGDGLLFQVVDGVIELVKDGADPEAIDDLVILPYRASDGMLAAVTAATTSATKFGPTPNVRVEGDIVGPGIRIAARAETTGAELIQKPSRVAGVGWVNNAKVLKFNLDELEAVFVRSIDPEVDETPVPPGAPLHWFDAGNVDGRFNTITDDGDALASWFDRGSRATPAVQVTGAARPEFVRTATRRRLGHAPAVRFATDDSMATPVGASVSGPMTVAAVFRCGSIAGNEYVVAEASGAAHTVRMFRNVADVEVGGASLTTIGTIAADDWNAATATLLDASSPFVLNSDDGVVGSDLRDAAGTFGLTLGAAADGTDALTGDIAEVLVWEGTVSHAEVVSYLVQKYGATFPQ